MGSGAAGIILVIVVLLFVMGLLGYAASVYNSLVQVSNSMDKAWKNIDVLLEQRHDELPKLIDTCKAYMKHERDVLEQMTKLRVAYKGAEGIARKMETENELNRQLARFRVSLEAYPDLKASQNFVQIQNRVSALESSIADRREFFNDSVNIYNIQIQSFPAKILASLLNYRKHAFLEVPEDMKQDVKMQFS